MTARQRIGAWCAFFLGAGIVLGAVMATAALTREPHPCDSVIVNHYERADHPVCVRYEYQPTKETE